MLNVNINQLVPITCQRCTGLNHTRKGCKAIKCFICGDINNHRPTGCPLLKCPFCADVQKHTVTNCPIVRNNSQFYQNCSTCNKFGHQEWEHESVIADYNAKSTTLRNKLADYNRIVLGDYNENDQTHVQAQNQLNVAQISLVSLRARNYSTYVDLVKKTINIFAANRRKKKRKYTKKNQRNNYRGRYNNYRGRGRGRAGYNRYPNRYGY